MIINKHTDEIIISNEEIEEYKTLAEAIVANKHDLSEADLRWADLRWADLSGADLHGAVGNNRELISVQTGKYIVNIWQDTIQIGCKRHAYGEWVKFDDEKIAKIDTGALSWWKTWKPIITQIYKEYISTKKNAEKKGG